MKLGFWLRWAWRDLRARWLQVAAIGLIIALSTGIFSGLGGQETWRTDSYHLSYERLNMHHLRMELADGSFVDQAELLTALAGTPGVSRMEARLIAPTLVDASEGEDAVLVTGRMIGVDVTQGGPFVNSVYVEDGYGRAFTAADAGQDVAVMEFKFAKHYGLEAGAPLRIAGDIPLNIIGAGHSPEYFMVISEGGGFLGESNLAVLFMPLETVQRVTGRAGLVNDAVFQVEDGADLNSVRAELGARMAAAFPDVGVTFGTREDDPVYPLLFADAKGDQTTWDLVAGLFLAGAAMGTFNLTGRMVESQRRQIGTGIALGVPRYMLAIRPLLVGAQIAVIGTVFGLIAGFLLKEGFASMLRSLTPMPYWDFSFYLPGFLTAAALGIALPLVATLIPVWRAMRVAPIDAIRSGYLVAKGGGLSGLSKYLPLPNTTFIQLPIKNILRSPWRTLLTVLGVSVAILLMTVFVGFMDTIGATIKQTKDAYLHQTPERVQVVMDFFYPADSERIAHLTGLTGEDGSPLFTQTETSLLIGGTLKRGDTSFEAAVELRDMTSGIWVPDLLQGRLTGNGPGIILSEKAAKDLGVSVGDTVILEHPQREGLMSFRIVETSLTVTGVHNNPFRPLAYMDRQYATILGQGAETLANVVTVVPAPGLTGDDIRMSLFTQPGVAAVQPILELTNQFDDLMGLVTGIMRIIQGVVLALAFLIAFNSTSINLDERTREIATMLAYGLPVRTVTRMQILENTITGFMGTGLGVLLGWLVLTNMLTTRVEEQMADMKFAPTLEPSTLVISMILGVLVVGLTPLLSIRRMNRLDLPSALRVVE